MQFRERASLRDASFVGFVDKAKNTPKFYITQFGTTSKRERSALGWISSKMGILKLKHGQTKRLKAT